MLRWKDKVLTGVDSGKLIKNSGAYFLLGLSIIAMTFFGICNPNNQGLSISGSAAKVGSEKVTPMEFQRAYANMRERLQAQYAEGFDPVAMQLPKYVMRQLVDERVAYQAALEAGIEAGEDDVIRLLKDAKAFQDETGKFNREAFDRYLSSNGYTEASFSSELRRSITVQNFRQFVSKASYVSSRAVLLQNRLNDTKVAYDYIKIEPSVVKLEISEADVKAMLNDAGKARVKTYYDSHSTEFNTKEKLRARHILISFTGAKSASGAAALRTKDDAKKLANSVHDRVTKPGADFAKVASEMTDEASGKTKGGDLGSFTREDMVKEFSDAAFALSPGQVSGVVESPFGFHVIKVEEKTPAKSVTLEQATPEIAKRLLKEDKAPAKLQEIADSLIADLKAGKSIDTALKAHGLKWETTNAMPIGSTSYGVLGGEPATVEQLSSLHKLGDIAAKAIDSRGSKFVVRLKDKTSPDTKSIDDKKKQELLEAASGSTGYSLLSAYEKTLRKELEAKGKIWENPQYLSLGQQQSGEGSGG